jgi:hypothetical protein
VDATEKVFFLVLIEANLLKYKKIKIYSMPVSVTSSGSSTSAMSLCKVTLLYFSWTYEMFDVISTAPLDKTVPREIDPISTLYSCL